MRIDPNGGHYTEPPPSRISESPPLPVSHTIQPRDSVWTITRKYNQTGAAWRDIYEIPQNKLIIGSDPTLNSAVGEVLIIPNSWLAGD